MYYSIFVITYTICSIIGYILDIYGSDDLIKQKIGTTDRNKMKETYRKIFPRVACNVVIATLPVAFLDSYYQPNIDFNILVSLWHFCLNLIISEILFYTVHRISHMRMFYAKYHKIHHELKEPIGMGALHTHWLDSIFGVLIPDSIGLYIMGAHKYTIYFWIVIATSFSILDSHSNYRNLSEYHDNHHRLTNYNFGNGFFMDKIFNTEYLVPLDRKRTISSAVKSFKSEVININQNIKKIN